MTDTIYKIMTRDDWDFTRTLGQYHGSDDDRRDGFIHFSTAQQMRVTAAKHFAGQRDLVLLALAADQFGGTLKWEPSRGGDLFPHLYGPMQASAVTRMWDLPLGDNGTHEFPEDAT